MDDYTLGCFTMVLKLQSSSVLTYDSLLYRGFDFLHSISTENSYELSLVFRYQSLNNLYAFA